MKLIHLSDLHLGKRVNGYSMIEDQEYILKEIKNIIYDEDPDGVIIAGDVYDKDNPSGEAVQLFDNFLTQLCKKGLNVFVIYGNHDSPEKIAFGSKLMDKSNIHMSPVYNGEITPFSLSDKYGKVNIYMLPFIKPATVRKIFNEDVKTYKDAVEYAIARMNIDTNQRNVLITHQFVAGAKRSDSEIYVGGTENIDSSVFAPFDYVALGHIHSPQNCGSNKIRYCGTPLKYSFSETKDEKSVTVVELLEKGNISYRTINLIPKHDFVELKDTYEQLTSKSFYEKNNRQEDYTHITLTDEEEIPYVLEKLRTVYHRLMKLDYDNTRTRKKETVSGVNEIENKSPLELFSDFYCLKNNQPMTDEQSEYVKKLIDEIWEGEQ